jgi:NAD-dependent DNA ligase
MAEKKRYNEEFIELMEKLSNIALKQGEPFRARAYQKAQETIMTYSNNINSPSQLKGLPNIGISIMDKLKEYVEKGTLQDLEKEKNNPVNILCEIYGIGPKKSQELVLAGIKTIDELRERQNELLNDVQKVGLKYYEQIQERIPRLEIEKFKKGFTDIFITDTNGNGNGNGNGKFEIVGSYRRGQQTSGDIDVIITGKTSDVYKKFVNDLLKTGIILEVLSCGESKTLVIAKLPGKNIARRIDFLYAPPDEFAFAILYFTGSKIFNTIMRQYSLDKGYTFNEHGIYKLENKKKGAKVNKEFNTEKDIFDFLGLQFKTPTERQDGRSVTPYTDVGCHLKMIEDFKRNGILVLESLNEKQLTDMIEIANQKYYNQTSIMTDNQYDIIKEYIEKKYPNNIAIHNIGHEVVRNKVQLPYEMASMNKIKPNTNELSNWINKFKGNYVLSCKLDGVSGLYTTEGIIPKLYTRGNGNIGQDISHLIPFLKLPKTKGVVIRGEFIIPKNVFKEKYKNTFANPRNMVAGIINHKHVSDTIVDIHFVAYEVIIPELIPSEQMEYLKAMNVECVLNQFQKNTLSNEMLSNLLVDWRQTYIYEIDGIIVTNDKIYSRKSGNPEQSFAFKMVLSDQMAEAKVVDVLWTPSKDGYLKPRVQIEPINLGGVTIEFATGFNAAFIKDNNIGIGTMITLIRSGDVIPYIKSVTMPSKEPKMPLVPYKWNDTCVDIMLENISEDSIVKEKNITGFFKGIEVEGLSSGNIIRLIKSGYDNVFKIIKMSEQDFLKVEGFKDKMANKIYRGIQEKLKEASIVTLMASSNIFGRGFNEKKIELILNELPDILVLNNSKEEIILLVASIKGMATKSAEAFVSKIADFKDFLIKCGLENKIINLNKKLGVQESVVKTHVLFGKTVILTGTRDKNIIEFLKNVGANQGSSVSKNTFLVIAKNNAENTGKIEEARKLNIPIQCVDEFIQTYF